MWWTYQDIEYEDESEGPEEAKDEYVEGEGGLPVDDVPLALPQKPDHVATVSTVASEQSTVLSKV